jgi:hypothetical protein
MQAMKTLYLVRSNPIAGKEDEFNEWYEKIHLDEVLQIPGVKSAQRFVLADSQIQTDQSHVHLAIYEIDSDDVEGTLENIRAASWLNMSEAMDFSSIDISVMSAAGEPRSS